MKAPILLLTKLTEEAILHARLRVWAAEVREQKPPYGSVASEATALAAALCSILDLIDVLLLSNRSSLLDFDGTKRMILKRLEELGLPPPG